MRSASPRHVRSTKAKRTGRHRAPSTHSRARTIIGAGALAATLVGAFAAYQDLPQQPGHVASGAADYRGHTPPLGDDLAGGRGKPRQPAKLPASATGKTHPPSATRQAGSSTQSRRSSGSSTASLRSAVHKDIANGNYLLAVAQYLVENGYSHAAAAGVASCVDGESAGNPESIGSGGGGLIGWTPINSAQPNSSIITGDGAHDMTTQLADILYYNSTEIGQSLVTQLNNISDPVAAADFYSENFEKPAVTNSDVVPSVAEQIFSDLGRS